MKSLLFRIIFNLLFILVLIVFSSPIKAHCKTFKNKQVQNVWVELSKNKAWELSTSVLSSKRGFRPL